MTRTRALPPRGPSTTIPAALTLIALLAAALALTATTTPATAAAATPVLAQGTGLHTTPSVRVRALQRALHARGYHLGPAGIDGRFGPATAAAVRRLQAHHRLAIDGIVGPRTRHALRLRTTPHPTATTRHPHTTTTTPTGARPAAAPTWPTAPRALTPAATPPAPPAATAPSLSGARTRSIAIALLACALTLAIWLTPRPRTRPRTPAPDTRPVLAAGRRVIAYVDLTADHHGHAADNIEKTCAHHHWHLLEVVTEHADRPAPQRAGLTYALNRIHHGDADALLIRDLNHLDPKARQRNHVTRTLHQTGAALITCAQAPHPIPPRRSRWRTATVRGGAPARGLAYRPGVGAVTDQASKRWSLQSARDSSSGYGTTPRSGV